MDISYIAMNRMAERHLRKDAAFRKKVPKDRLHISLSGGRRMSDEELLLKLRSFGLEIERQTLCEWRKGFLSAEAIAKWIIAKRDISAEGLEIDWVWICLTVLWERWFPETPSLEKIDDMMQEGYDRLARHDSVGASEIWLKVWGLLLNIADLKKTATIDDLDRIFRGTQSIFNWVQDLETELCNASMKKKEIIGNRISFCEKLLRRFPNENSLLLENMRRALADSYFESGNKEKADFLFQEWLKDDPCWGWGWIGWADCYWLMGWREKDFEKAEKILQEGFAVPGVRDKEFIKERLKHLYSESGREENLESLRAELEPKKVEYDRGVRKTSQARKVKVGRNEPCPCGSGKKYKKCCDI